MAKYDLHVIPVVDADGSILGMVAVDDVLDALTRETTREVQRIGAVEPLDVPTSRRAFFPSSASVASGWSSSSPRTLGVGLGAFGFMRVLMYRDQHLPFAITVGLTLIGIVVAGCTVGSMLPLILKKCGVDPATSSTPFIASLVDVLGILVFVHVAKVIMASVIEAHGVPVPP